MQLATRFHEAPVAYLLSAFAAAVYIVATVGLVRGGRGGRRLALVAISVELVGVLVVGTLSLVDPAAFPDETVWSAYGRGYYFVPLVLPVLGLLLLRRTAQKSPPPKSPPPKSRRRSPRPRHRRPGSPRRTPPRRRRRTGRRRRMPVSKRASATAVPMTRPPMVPSRLPPIMLPMPGPPYPWP